MNDDHGAVYEALAQAQAAGQAVALATVVQTEGSIPRHAGSKMMIDAEGKTVGTIGGGAMEGLVIATAQESLKDGQTRLETYTLNNIEDGAPGICGGTAQIFIEPIGIQSTLVVIGGGHCGKELAQLGKWMGYRVVLSDDREAFCNPDYVPGLDEYIVCKPAELTDRIPLNAHSYVACVTRGLPVDIHLIPALLKTDAAYIGVIGSKRRWSLTVNALEEETDLTKDDLTRIHAPIGLELEAETPKEIAVSIMAEIIMMQRGGTGKPMGMDLG